IELARYAHEIASAPLRTHDLKQFAMCPKLKFGGTSQRPLILSEPEAHAQWRSQFDLPESERPDWMPPLPVVSLNSFRPGSVTRPHLEASLPVSGSEEPEFVLYEESQER